MTNQEYKQKKCECWDEYKRQSLDGEVQWQPVSRYDVFCAAFDRAYALGKQFGNSEQVDAEGEEMLTVPRKRVEKIFVGQMEVQKCTLLETIIHCEAAAKTELLYTLFGSKCLPDNVESSEPNVDSLPQNPTENCDNKSHISADCNKPAEPKFKIGDKVRYRPSGEVYEVEGKTGRQHYALKGWLTDIVESDLEPYTRSNPNPSNSRELKLSTAEDKSEMNYVNLSQNIKNCDNRLQIAAMAMQGILINENAIQYAINNFRLQDGSRNRYQAVAECSLAFADALIAESEKRSGHGK
mgnify:CR=1 FL=1